MILDNRHIRQIDTLLSVFQHIHTCFFEKQPVDQTLTCLFRRERKFGARDRRFIANAIFGYYRWWGWLRQIEEKRLSSALLLGYLFDGHPIDDLIRFWWRQTGHDEAWLSSFAEKRGSRLWLNQSVAMREGVKECACEDLLPDFVSGWSVRLIGAMQTRPGLWVRLDGCDMETFTSVLQQRDVRYRIDSNLPDAVEILTPINLNEIELYRAGKLEVQDIASQIVGWLCQPERGGLWWDACAGSGGKALHLSSLMQQTGNVYATEIKEKRYWELRRRLNKKHGRHNIVPVRWHGQTTEFLPRKPDGILVDAPCTGSGTWRRKPDLRWTTEVTDIRTCSQIQLDLLLSVCDRLSPGGWLVYATCSLFPPENEETVFRFLSIRKDFEWDDPILPHGVQSSENGIYLCPPEIDGNGMYVARLRRKG